MAAFKKRALDRLNGQINQKTKVKAIHESKAFIEMKSSKVMKKPRFDEYIHELCHQEITDKIKKKYFGKEKERVHARVVAKYKSR